MNIAQDGSDMVHVWENILEREDTAARLEIYWQVIKRTMQERVAQLMFSTVQPSLETRDNYVNIIVG